MTFDPELYRLQRDVMDRFKARPFASWPKPLLRETIRLFDLAGITPADAHDPAFGHRLQVVR